MNVKLQQRKSIRLRDYDYSSAGMYFVTICAKGHERLFGHITDGIIRIVGAIHESPVQINHESPVQINHESPVQINHESPVQINHESPVQGDDQCPANAGAIHELPVQKRRRKMLLSKIIGRFKMTSAKQINQLRHSPGISVWHRNYYESIIRSEFDLHKIREYIHNNPDKWGEDKYYEG